MLVHSASSREAVEAHLRSCAVDLVGEIGEDRDDVWADVNIVSRFWEDAVEGVYHASALLYVELLWIFDALPDYHFESTILLRLEQVEGASLSIAIHAVADNTFGKRFIV